uniref:Aminoglycoside phosphotransferase domain-containing protein n=1 Tax=Ditylum brightwellii TaxID=49249 RepID=A0A7S2EKU7_9STRA
MANILTEETVAAYVSKHAEEIGVFSPGSDLSVKAIVGGNVNFAFRVASKEEDGTEKSVFVKQAPEYVAIFGPDGLPLTSERMQKEYDVYKAWGDILGEELTKKYLPTIYYFDKVNMVFVMEFFEGFTLLDHDLVEKGVVPISIATGLAEFMGKTHAATHSSKLSSERVKEMSASYQNQPMRDIQLEYVFTKCYKEATDEQRAGLNVDDAFLKEIETLKKEYNGETDNLALQHGDLHPGSVMVNSEGEVKVIDPEFTVYGPPGLDVGSLLSGYVLAAVHQAFSDKPEAVESLSKASVDIWNCYKDTMAAEGISEDIIHRIEVETVGFTVAEVCRTALQFAGGRLWLQFEDKQVKADAIKTAMRIVEACMTGRHEGGIELLFSEIKAVSK